MKRVLLTFIATFITTILVIAIYFLMLIKTKQNIYLPKDNNNSIYSVAVVNYLKKNGYSVGYLDELFLKQFTKPQAGWIYINKKKLPRYKFLLQVGSYANHYTPITIIPGETTYYVLRALKKKLNLNLMKLELNYNKLAPFKEGNFLANTYNIPIYFKEKDVIKFLINSSLKEYKKISYKYYNDYNPKIWNKLLTIASIVQKEAANKNEMPIIASVIYNRLNKKMRLQMDGTLNYGIYSHKKITPLRIKNDTTTYNTYKHRGLPKYPVCNVSKDSILAAINPTKSEYLYFMKNSKGRHNFSKDYKKHIKNIKKRKEELKGYQIK